MKLDNFIELMSRQYGINIVEQDNPMETNLIEMNKNVARQLT